MSSFFPPHLEAPVAVSTRRRALRRALGVLAVLVLLALAAAATYAGLLSHTFSHNVVREPLLPDVGGARRPSGGPSTSASEPPRPPIGRTDAVNYVLMGSDSRVAANAGAGRSDTLMVVHLTADRKHAYLISFPRDMYVAIPGHAKAKINAAFSYGGPQLAIRTLEDLLNTRMQHAALVDFDGFIGLTNELGGVTVDNQHASTSRGYHFPAGPITISGDQALAYVRERYDLPRGDLDRAERQRDVVQAILAKGLSAATVANPIKFNGFVAGMAQHVVVDSELSDAVIRKTALSLRMTGSDVRQLQAPISGFATVRGQSIDVVNYPQLKELSQALQDDTLDVYLSRHPSS